MGISIYIMIKKNLTTMEVVDIPDKIMYWNNLVPNRFWNKKDPKLWSTSKIISPKRKMKVINMWI